MRVSVLHGLAIALGLTLASISATQAAEAIDAQLTIHADKPGATIRPEIYGHFAEHLGRCIYEGVWVGPDSSIPNTRGIRNDVIAALKKIQVPFVRWPGGCFADEYHWRDGIGPRDQRPKRVNTHWGGVIEPNSFGTHEFLDFCEQLGCDAYVSANVGSGTPQEMMEWIEYMTSDLDSTLANERRKNGRDKPWKVKYIGVGNESWGCGGNMRPEYYADEYRRYATFVKNYSGNKITKIACGSNGGDVNWTDVVTKIVGPRNMAGLSLHYYTLPSGNNWNKKGAATGFPVEEWESTIAGTWKMESILKNHLAAMDKYDPQHRVGLVVDEWGTWYDQEPGSTPGFLYQQNSVRDAVACGINLNLFNANADRISMAAIAQMVNVLQTMILTDKEKMILTPTYHVFQMYTVHHGATLLPTDNPAPDHEVGKDKIRSVFASSSKDKDGKIHISLVNGRHDTPAKVTAKIDGAAMKKVTGRILTSEKMDAHNTFEQPEAVKPAAFEGAEVKDGAITLTLPAKSVVVLEVE